MAWRLSLFKQKCQFSESPSSQYPSCSIFCEDSTLFPSMNHKILSTSSQIRHTPLPLFQPPALKDISDSLLQESVCSANSCKSQKCHSCEEHYSDYLSSSSVESVSHFFISLCGQPVQTNQNWNFFGSDLNQEQEYTEFSDSLC